MRGRKTRDMVNFIMMISLIIVFVSGLLLKVMPGMWMGITHGLSGIVLVASAAVHYIQNRRVRR